MFIPRLTYCKIKHFLFYALRKGKNDKPLAFFFFSPFFKVTVLLTHVSSFCFVLLANSFLSILFLHVIFSEKGCHFFPSVWNVLKIQCKNYSSRGISFCWLDENSNFFKENSFIQFLNLLGKKKKSHCKLLFCFNTVFSLSCWLMEVALLRSKTYIMQ